MHYIPSTISQVQNENLLKQIIEEEVKGALFQMHPDKSPGPDGMTPALFQKQWIIVGRVIVTMVCQFFSDGVLSDGLNDTNIVLIPKKKFSSLISDLRPISLCNVLIKIITKVIANRMNCLLSWLCQKIKVFYPREAYFGQCNGLL